MTLLYLNQYVNSGFKSYVQGHNSVFCVVSHCLGEYDIIVIYYIITNMSTSDHLSLSSCTVICLWDKYHAEFSTVEPVALFFTLLMMVLTIIMCLSISNPNFLFQKPFTHGTESCIKISAFLKSFAVFIFLLQKKWLV